MKHFLLIVLFLILCSCSIVDVEDYEHEPTHNIRNSIIHWKYHRVAKLSNEFLLVPNFREFSKSFSPHNSGRLYVLSKNQIKISIESVSLRSETRPETLIIINKSEELERVLTDTHFFHTNIEMLSSDTFPVEKWNSEPIIWLTIRYSINDGESKAKTFRIEHKISKNIAWSTWAITN